MVSLARHALCRGTTFISGSVLLVAHGASLDTCTRQICGNAPRSGDSFFDILQQTPYLSTAEAAETSNGRFELLGSPVPSLAHSANSAYDSTILKGGPSSRAGDME